MVKKASIALAAISAASSYSSLDANVSIERDFVEVRSLVKFVTPILSPDKEFVYDNSGGNNSNKGMTSAQITPISLKETDADFVHQTGAGMSRAIGTAELFCLIDAALSGVNVKDMPNHEKHNLAKSSMIQRLAHRPDEIKSYNDSLTISPNVLAELYDNLKKSIYEKSGINPNEVSIEDVRDTLVALNCDEEVPLFQRVIDLEPKNGSDDAETASVVSDFEYEMIETAAPALNSAGGPLDSLVNDLEKQLSTLKELEYKFTIPAKPTGWFSYFKQSNWEKSRDLMLKKRAAYDKQISEIEAMIKKEKAVLSAKSNLDATAIELFKDNATRSIKGTLDFVAWATENQKTDQISERIFQSWIK